MRLRLLPALVALCPFAHSQEPDPREILLHARQRVLETVDRLPKYMCTETVQRFRYTTGNRRHLTACDEPSGPKSSGNDPNRQPIVSDRLRLDVAVSPRREIYSWHGADRFDDRDLLDIVDDGAISTGEFAGYLTNIFRTSAANFTYNGDHKDEKGRTLAEFGYSVALDKSNHVFGNRRFRTLTGYDGTVLIDAQTADLIKLTLRTARLPEQTGSCDATTTVTYTRVPLNDSDFLLPAETNFRVVALDGTISENRATYTACHEFRADSRISFDEPALPSQPTAPKPLAPPPLYLRPGLPFRLKITHEIDTASAAAGDPFTAEFAADLTDKETKLSIPAGTLVHGRIMRVQRNYGSKPSLFVVIKLETIEALGKTRPFRAKGEAAVTRFNAAGISFSKQRVELGSLDSMTFDDTAELFLLNPPEHHIFPPGTEMKWVTVARHSPASKP